MNTHVEWLESSLWNVLVPFSGQRQEICIKQANKISSVEAAMSLSILFLLFLADSKDIAFFSK